MELYPDSKMVRVKDDVPEGYSAHRALGKIIHVHSFDGNRCWVMDIGKTEHGQKYWIEARHFEEIPGQVVVEFTRDWYEMHKTGDLHLAIPVKRDNDRRHFVLWREDKKEFDTSGYYEGSTIKVIRKITEEEDMAILQLSEQEIEDRCNTMLGSHGGYTLYTDENNEYFHAGCRNFTRADAITHWTRRKDQSGHHSNSFNRAVKFLKAIEANPRQEGNDLEQRLIAMEAANKKMLGEHADAFGKQKKLIDDLKAELKEKNEAEAKAEAAKKVGQFRPKVDQQYYYVIDGKSTVNINYLYWLADPADRYRLAQGNVFRTKEEAEAYMAKILAIGEVNAMIDEVNDGWVEDWDNYKNSKWNIIRNHKVKILECSANQFNAPSDEALHRMKSPDSCRQVISKITPEQIKAIWG